MEDVLADIVADFFRGDMVELNMVLLGQTRQQDGKVCQL